ncbi:MAG: hypothetical protein ABR981_03840 [Candidatus Micrarchaeaceae archaeon]|jgi:hypothetical protein
MDLFGKVAVIVVILIVIFTAAFILFQHTAKQTQLTATQAEQYVINDLKASNPNANITIINVSNSSLKNGSYNIILSIVYNGTRPCPTLSIVGYDYPATGLVPSVDNLYTSKCVIYGLSNAPSFVISSKYIAIAESYDKNLSQISDYVNTFGYYNTNVHATYYALLNNTQTHLTQSLYNVWLVQYKATNANYSVYAVIDSSGAIVGNYISNNSTA